MIKTFATFRVAGPSLVSDEVSNFLETPPTHTHEKGQEYSTGRSIILPQTGVWLFSTDRISTSKNIFQHLQIVLSLMSAGLFGNRLENKPAQEHSLELVTRFLRLSEFLKGKNLTATVTLFWHGKANASYPKIPAELIDFFKAFPIEIELDFDRDEDKRRKAA